MRWRKLLLAAAASTAALLGTSANAHTALAFDVNNLKTVASGTFSSTFTGTVSIDDMGSSTLNGMEIKYGGTYDYSNGTYFGGTSTSLDISGWALTDFDADITFSGGAVTGGTVTLEVTKGLEVNSYTADLFDLTGATTIQDNGDGTFRIKTGTEDGTFTVPGTTFAGNDISSWLAQNGDLFGSFLEFTFAPDGSNTDTNSQVEMLVVVPVPPAVGLGLAGLLGVAVLRRRRNKVA